MSKYACKYYYYYYYKSVIFLCTIALIHIWFESVLWLPIIQYYLSKHPEGTQDCVGVNLWLMTEFDFTSLFKSNLSLFPLSPAVIHYSTDNKETCERYQQQCSQNARCTDYSTGFCCHCNSGFYGNGRHCLPNGKTAVKRAVVKATHNMTLFWKYEQHSQYISGDILSVFLFPTHYFKSKHVYFCNAKELVDNIFIWYANSKQLFPVKLGLLLTVPLRA